MKYYKIQDHKRDEHADNWYDHEGYNKYDTKSEAYEALMYSMQRKLIVFMYPNVDQFRIIFVNEDPVYTTWQFNA